MESGDWPDTLDALVAAPEQHRLLLENDDVRVLDTRVAGRETVPLHTHRWPAVLYVLSPGDVIRRDGAGEIVLDTRATGSPLGDGVALWSAPLPPHTLENPGDTEIRVIAVELKR